MSNETLEVLRQIEIGEVTLLVEQVFDDCPDLSWLGKYTNHPPVGVRVIDRQKKGDWSPGEYRYFVPGISFEEHRQGLIEIGYNAHHAASEAGYYNHQDYRRFEAYNHDQWCMTGIVATVEIEGVEVAHSSVWGIESDIDQTSKDDLRELVYSVARTALAKAREWLDRR